jgi:hypothetical protein
LKGHKAQVGGVVIALVGSWLANVSSDKAARAWAIEGGFDYLVRTQDLPPSPEKGA